MEDERMVIGNILGQARYEEWFKNGRQVKATRGSNEIFFHIEWRNGTKKHGYVKVTPAMWEIFNTLIHERPSAFSIYIIEWDYSYNVIFKDGLCISEKMCRMEKKDFEAWERTIIPAK